MGTEGQKNSFVFQRLCNIHSVGTFTLLLSHHAIALIVVRIFTLGYNTNAMIGFIRGGAAQHLDKLSLGELIVEGKTFLAATILWPIANTFVKISILHFYTTIFRNRNLTCVAFAIGAITVAYCLSTVLVALLLCRPIAYNWDKTIPGHCGSSEVYYLSTGIVNLIIDISIVALPMPMLWGLQMKVSKKLALTLIFGLGALICVISILRIVSIQELNFLDVSYDIALDDVWTSLEPTLGVINACLPILQPVAFKISQSSLLLCTKIRKSGRGLSREKLWTNKPSKTHSGESTADPIRRLPSDMYPLTDVTATQNQIWSSGSNKISETDIERMTL